MSPELKTSKGPQKHELLSFGNVNSLSFSIRISYDLAVPLLTKCLKEFNSAYERDIYIHGQ